MADDMTMAHGDAMRTSAEMVFDDAHEFARNIRTDPDDIKGAALAILGHAYAKAIAEAIGPGASLARRREGLLIAGATIGENVAYYSTLVEQRGSRG